MQHAQQLGVIVRITCMHDHVGLLRDATELAIRQSDHPTIIRSVHAHLTKGLASQHCRARRTYCAGASSGNKGRHAFFSPPPPPPPLLSSPPPPPIPAARFTMPPRLPPPLTLLPNCRPRLSSRQDPTYNSHICMGSSVRGRRYVPHAWSSICVHSIICMEEFI